MSQDILQFLKDLKTEEPYSDRQLDAIIIKAERLLEETTITIEIRAGVLVDVRGLPKGWSYRLVDHDIEVTNGE